MINGRMYIDGEWIDGVGERVDVINPARGNAVGSIPQATPEQIDRALGAARRSFRPWAHQAPVVRSRLLKRAAAIIGERAGDLGRLLTSEQG